ncbi:hypothetical protein ACFFV7_50165 [Nonomuraea spiralis]|uniref:Glycoside hydrolase family 65 n=1 Tax=Nonomuraea spiralis TaxID=46182 RepID=A0ABV5IY17_9ACTN|nr:hypothetical protein [Nonomuraea spiralis]GGS89638.1 hypothetical protein GCM10010176_036940 [Nonomuraea spiralis]
MRRHTVADAGCPLTVGNGEFAFTADATGLQTFAPLGTQAQWGWHTMPNPEGHVLEDAFTDYDGVGYPDLYPATQAGGWLHVNPHRLHLGRIGLDVDEAAPLGRSAQTLDLWTGTLSSSFELGGLPYEVETVCHPERDLLAVRVVGGAGIRIAFPYASDGWHTTADWDKPDRHTTTYIRRGSRCDFTRVLDQDGYHVAAEWTGPARLTSPGAHVYLIQGDELELVVEFAREPVGAALPSFSQVRTAAAAHWERFWTSGGAVSFEGSADPRAPELERRVVLSQYLTAVNCAGTTPPQETGLAVNSWSGKFHLEMHWWHAAHFALWGRPELLERSLPWYRSILPRARATAARQGFRGARWPKQVGPEGRESPSEIGAFIVWQQPHLIYFAELLRRVRPGALEDYRDLVFETAEFMASFAGDGHLGPPLVPAQESYYESRRSVRDPTFELAYWWWGLETAQRWRGLLGLGPDPEWARVLDGLARPAVRDGVYAAIGVEPYTIRTDHPSMTGALGFVPPTPLIDPETMRATLHDVLADWDLESTWGWDYPMLAMCAARLGEPGTAVDALLLDVPKNTYLASGHNHQWPGLLPLYLPGNGGLLAAVAHMAAEGCFPEGWLVQAEGVVAMP